MYLLPAPWRALSLRSQQGVSLIATMLIMAALSVMGASAIFYSSRTQATAEFSAEKDNTVNLAESGMNFARSLLWEVVDTGGDPTDAAALPNASSPATATVNGETISYYGVFDSGTNTWTLVGEATATNPAAGAEVKRAVETQVTVAPASGGGSAGQLWDWSFADPSSCVVVWNNAIFDAPFKVDGNLCFNNNSHFTGDTLEVSGTVTIGNGASVGYSGTPITSANLVGGCTGGGTHPCTSADDVYAGSITQDPFGVTKPTIVWQDAYDSASPGPTTGCDTGSFPPGFDDDSTANSSYGTVDLTPNSSYDCQTSDGRIAWDDSNDLLTIEGTVYVDGNIQLNNNEDVEYDGIGTLYARGTITFRQNSSLCGDPQCDSDWDPTLDSLVLVGYNPGNIAFNIENNAEYQGRAILEGDYYLTNNAANWGPVISDEFTTRNNAGTFTPIVLSGGTPDLGGGGTPSGYTLTNVVNSYISYTPGAGNDPNN